jgi:hypothetical protein
VSEVAKVDVTPLINFSQSSLTSIQNKVPNLTFDKEPPDKATKKEPRSAIDAFDKAG